ncbi:MAG: YaiO family outer membrane beta-barrel protein [Comamonadaceae bacterium]|nr:YaiO family outer membrane beta-barrel protein [Comamonadaceae bacterium]RRD57017.1 YaiO family outer membrane beta-barrel protein [Comamonadaceae bacterium OH2545_COT-014]
MPYLRPSTLLLLTTALSTPAVFAQTAASPAPATPVEVAPAAQDDAGTNSRVEVGFSGAHLTDGNRSWRDGYVRGHTTLRPGTVFNWELASQGHYGQRGTLGAVSVTQDLSPLWYVSGGLSAGSAEFQNSYRIDAGVHRKWGPTQQWVTGLALMRSASRDRIHKDWGLTGSVSYYSTDKWVAEGGLVLNHSNPGAVNSHRVFGAFTLGEDKKNYLTLRLDHGQEAYLPSGAIAEGRQANVRFNSTEASVQWRQWISPRLGYLVGLQAYHNPYYNRVGASAGLFYDF